MFRTTLYIQAIKQATSHQVIWYPRSHLQKLDAERWFGARLPYPAPLLAAVMHAGV